MRVLERDAMSRLHGGLWVLRDDSHLILNVLELIVSRPACLGELLEGVHEFPVIFDGGKVSP